MFFAPRGAARVLVVLVTLICWRGVAVSQVRTLTMSPALQFVSPGSSGSVNLVVDSADNLLAADIGIVYDGSLLSVQPSAATTATGCLLFANTLPDGEVCLALACTTPLAGTNVTLATTEPGHLGATGGGAGSQPRLMYATPSQTNLDNNSVDLDRERAAFAENSVKYQATLRFIGSDAKTLTAINGQ